MAKKPLNPQLLVRSEEMRKVMAALAARSQPTRGGTRLSSWSLFGKSGHWEVTQDVAEDFGFSSAGVEILCDASQAPDSYEFTNLAAHAQTPDPVAMMKPGSP